jgi:hypothetical protein
MTCPCDQRVFPPPLAIAAGLAHIPRQIATFPEWRNALLAALGGKPALADWRAREPNDFGIMLLEMWAYVCDSISFYDEVIAHESYLRTARLRPSLRKLVQPLGYIPRPAVTATVTLAAFADGRKPVTLPPGTAFRSAAFGANPPQVFELEGPTTIHPLLNQWTFRSVRPTTLGDPNAVIPTPHLLLQPNSLQVNLQPNDLLLIFEEGGTWIRRVRSVVPHRGMDGDTYDKLELDATIYPIGYTEYAQLRVLRPTATGSLWKLGTLGSDPQPITATQIVLDGLNRQITAGSYILLSKGADIRWFQVAQATESMRTLLGEQTSTLKDANGVTTGSVVSPPVKVPVTVLTLDANINGRKQNSALPDWSANDAAALIIHYGLTQIGRITAEASTSLSKGDLLQIQTPVEDPGTTPASFLMEDKNGEGLAATGTLGFTGGNFAVDAGVAWDKPLVTPVRLYGNVVTATRGETVPGEVLGVGDAPPDMQTFILKKKPLTYIAAPTAGNEQGVQSTLKVYVNGVQWREVSTFFGVSSQAQVYIVRQDDEGASSVMFGGGARLPTGALVLAYYRFGAGAASPPAGAIQQLARPVPGLKGVRNPVAAFGGDDAETSEHLATFAPRSALLLGRAVSMQDFEVAAATVGGVRAVSAEWRWNKERQQPLVQIYYIGEAGLTAIIRQKLHGLTDPTTPIEVDHATPLPRTIAIDIGVDQKYLVNDVVNAVRQALLNKETGLLAPERIGIGKPLFRSHIFAVVLSVPGTVAVRGLLLNSAPLPEYGVSPGAGNYFDFENGSVVLNGMIGNG